MAFGPQALFRDVNLILRAGERIAVVGPNGSGKTTLLRLILDEVAPASGRIRLGSGVKPGYYAQETGEPGSGIHAIRDHPFRGLSRVHRNAPFPAPFLIRR